MPMDPDEILCDAMPLYSVYILYVIYDVRIIYVICYI